MQSTDKDAEGKTTLPDTKNRMKLNHEVIIENVVDIESYHSKMCSELREENEEVFSSDRSSKFSTKAK